MRRYDSSLDSSLLLEPRNPDSTSQSKNLEHQKGWLVIVKVAKGRKLGVVVKKVGNGQWQYKDIDTGRLEIVDEAAISPSRS